MAIAAAALAAAACARPAPQERVAPSDEMLDTLSVLATDARPTDEQRAARDAAFASGQLTVPSYVDALLADPRFGRTVVPRFVFKQMAAQDSNNGFPKSDVLEHAPDAAGVEIYDNPATFGSCKPDQTVEVTPWWDRSKTVRVCKDSYRPDVWRDTRFPSKEKQVTRCDALIIAGGPQPYDCGCGPDLMRCARDLQHFEQIKASLREEVARTTEWIVDGDLPIPTLFTSNQTWRDRNAEYVYRLWRAEAAEKPVDFTGLDQWPADGKLAPREELEPGMHAGVLTTPHLVYFNPDRRQRMKIFYQILWCADASSTGATAKDILDLGTGNLEVTNDGWKVLAAKPVCTDCHARMDYGARFFWGFEDAQSTADHYLSESQLPGSGPLYAEDIDDPRGEAPLTPAGFASLALAQPEFRRCMVRDVVSHVFGDRATEEDRKAVGDVYQRTPTFRAITRAAMLRFADAWSRRDLPGAAPSPAEPATMAVATTDSAGTVAIGPALRRELDGRCMECHDGKDKTAPVLGGATLPRRLAVRMLDQVAFGRMPKDPPPLARDERNQLVDLMISALWSDPASQEVARAHFGRETSTTLSPFSVDTAASLIGAAAGAPPASADWRLVERAQPEDQQQFNPGYAAITSLLALDACKKAGDKGDALDACLDRALQPARLVRYPLLPRPTATPAPAPAR